MKKTILAITASSFITLTALTSCSSPAEKVDAAQTNVVEANEELRDANEDYKKDIENYRRETADRISANDQSAYDFRLRIENEKKDAKADYNQKIEALEKKNSDMKKKMDDYKMDGKDKWETFKTEFSHDMDELGSAFKDLTVKNVK